MIIYKIFRFDSARYLPNVPEGHNEETCMTIPIHLKYPYQENPISENLCLWLWKNIKPEIPDLYSIELNETPDSGVIYRLGHNIQKKQIITEF